MITLFDKATKSKLALLDDIIIEDSISITRQINGEFSLRFEALEADLKSEYFQSEAYVDVDGCYFDIAYVEQLHSDVLNYSIECEHVTYRLIAEEVPYYTFDGTPSEILSDILTGTEFLPGQIDSTEVLTFAVYEENNKLGLIKLLANKLGAEMDYDGFKIDLKDTVGQDRGFQARFGKNIKGIKKIIDKRNNRTCYSVDLLELKNHQDYSGYESLETIEEGDTIRIVDEVMGLDVVNKVIKRTYNPVKAINTSLEIANSIELLTDTVTNIQRNTVAKNKLYHGIRISPDNGFESIRSDNMARGIFNSDTFALQTGDGTGQNWINKVYFDPASGKYIFDGMLSADIISALSALITPNFYAGKATISELTVDSLETGDKVGNYLASDTSDVNYQHIYDQYHKFIVAQTDGTSFHQVKNRAGALLFWIDDTLTAASTTVTEWPVYVYDYTETTKLDIAFELEGTSYVPKLIMGAGTGVGDNSKAKIYKSETGFYIDYYNSTSGEKYTFQITDTGIDFTGFPEINYSEGTAIKGLVQLWVQSTVPTNAKANDVFIDTDDYSRYDKVVISSNQTLAINANEIVLVSGTTSVTLHSATVTGIIKKIYNIGVGIVTIVGLINDIQNLLLYPKESIELVTDGSGWRC